MGLCFIRVVNGRNMSSWKTTWRRLPGNQSKVQQFRISLAKLQKRLDAQSSSSAFLSADSNETSIIAEFESPRVNELLLARNKCYWSEEKRPRQTCWRLSSSTICVLLACHSFRQNLGHPLDVFHVKPNVKLTCKQVLRFNHTCIISVSKMNWVLRMTHYHTAYLQSERGDPSFWLLLHFWHSN